MFHRNRTTLELTAQISNHMRSAIRWFLEPGIQIKVSTFLHFQRLHRPAAEPGQYHIQNNWSTDPRCAVLISNQRLQNRDSITISLLIQNYPYFYETNVLPLNPALYFVRSLKHTNRSCADYAVYFQIAHDKSTCVRVTPSHCIHHMNPVTQNVAKTVNL